MRQGISKQTSPAYWRDHRLPWMRCRWKRPCSSMMEREEPTMPIRSSASRNFDLRSKPIRLGDVVGVHSRDVTPSARGKPDVQSGGDAGICRVPQHTDSRVRQSLQIIGGFIGGSVIDDDHFKILKMLPENALDGSRKKTAWRSMPVVTRLPQVGQAWRPRFQPLGRDRGVSISVAGADLSRPSQVRAGVPPADRRVAALRSTVPLLPAARAMPARGAPNPCFDR